MTVRDPDRVTTDEREPLELLRAVGHDPDDLAELTGGTWSRAFSFTSDGRRLVARFHRDGTDLRKDVLAQRWNAESMPVPRVLSADDVGGWTVVVTDFVEGVALERVDGTEWNRIVQRVADMLDALRTASPAGPGWGPWSAHGAAPASGWREWLLGVGSYAWVADHSDWRDAATPQLTALFDRGYGRLHQVADDDVPRSLVHADLIHGNVMVSDDRITGVFDWQCSVYGDHLYDLAWFEFFEPWHIGHDVSRLVSSLSDRWRRARSTPERWEQRREACLLHIGLDHVVYGLQHQSLSDAEATAERLRSLIPSLA
jgi:hygromycin-B 4-O-kinase